MLLNFMNTLIGWCNVDLIDLDLLLLIYSCFSLRLMLFIIVVYYCCLLYILLSFLTYFKLSLLSFYDAYMYMYMLPLSIKTYLNIIDETIVVN